MTADEPPSFLPLRELTGVAGDRSGAEIERLSVEDLDSSYEWLSSLAASTTLGIFLHDFSHILWANRAIERLTGYGRDELAAFSPLDLVDPAARALLAERGRDRQQRGDTTPRRYEVRLVRKDGRQRWAEISLTSILYRGRLAGLGTVFDIDERKQTEQALRATEERLTLAQQAGDIAVWEWDIAEDRLVFSPHARDMLPLGPGDSASGRDFFALVHPQDLPRVQAALALTVDEDRDFFVEHRVVLPSGQTRWLTERGRLVRGEGRANRLIGVAIDITHRKLAEEALFQEKERAQVTLASIGDGVIRTDARGMVDFMNPAAERLTGWSIHEAYGRHLRDVFQVVDPEAHMALLDPVTRCLAEGRYVEFPGERLLMPRASHPVAVRDSASPIVNRQGRTVGAVLAFKDVTELREMEHEHSFLTTHDPLTGLLNRRSLERQVEVAAVEARAGRDKSALLLLDVDQFHLVNDTCGHFAGDQVLKAVAGAIAARSPAAATAGRLGADEFAVILPATRPEAALEVAHGIREAIESAPLVFEGRPTSITVSIGMFTLGETTLDGPSALAAADAARFAAHQRGGNRVHEYRPGDDAIARRVGELQWIQEIQRAFEDERFRIYGQRIVPLHAGVAIEPMVELFLRMLNERGEPVPTAAFIAAAERYRTIASIDRWVVRESLARLAASPGPTPVFSVNLSGHSLGDEAFLEHVLAGIEGAGIDPHRLCFEITETAAIANLSAALRFMSALRGLGCRFVLDDFGTGFSSFAYLKNLPVDFLKIDASFTHQLAADPIQRALVESIQQIGSVLGMRTIAEGIEDEETLAVVRELGVDYGQGFALHRPAPISEVL
ncbi:MAG: EAL domain-containing protein [Thermoanaerobaculia bacterium]|nr:MAG: EAL domain-containing protein [Thermoanaerobaculia bacterium]MBZ0100613.1 EAL domain-containing protein [Thermoanaerobaculia bacterium]